MVTFLALEVVSSVSSADAYQRFADLSSKKQALMKKQADATVPLHVKDGLNCTAVVIGNQGEALTNLHCVESCLEKNKAVLSFPLNGTEISINAVSSSKLPVECLAQVEPNPKAEFRTFKVLKVFGPGWLSPREKLPLYMNQNPQKYLELANAGFESFGDMALIQLPQEAVKGCVKVGSQKFDTNEPPKLFNLAFPIVARKVDDNPMGDVIFTLGYRALFSSGAASSNLEVLKSKLSPELVANLDLVASKGLLVSSVDCESGASGSPLFDENGDVVALIRSTWKGYDPIYAPWTAGAIDLGIARESILKAVPACKN